MTISLDHCWNWGGTIRQSDRRAVVGDKYAYRLVYEAATGTSTEGLVVHHTCENPACINPAHLRCITQAEHAAGHLAERNRRRLRTHCRNGHPYTPENTRWIDTDKSGRYRVCIICARAAKRRHESKEQP